ncbi:MAG TPA: UDP-2,4-diacetamido-2,4,6-trideoxy-beta-L-altropyranose hydrolase [Terriglobia bacterium]|nr:UDP-2,4-diacetamido-2,4,6-trideoxy-beta-L-altropyranose hydrolase [Terriglobia bacterium]
MTRILFRADAGAGVGLGHCVRSLALAVAARDLGADCRLLVAGAEDSVGTHRLAAGSGFHIEFLEQVALGGREDFARTLAAALRQGSDVVVVDSYRACGRYLEKLRAAGFVVLAIDDLAEEPFPCQIVVNGGAQASKLRYRSSSGDTCFLLGPHYALLRPQFRGLPRRVVAPVAKNVLITLGSEDGRNVIPTLIATLGKLSEDLAMVAVLGPLIANRGEIELATHACGDRVRLVNAPVSMRELMLSADLAVAAGGQTTYELAATGTPTVAIEVAANQAASLRALAQAGVLGLAGRASEPNVVERVKAAVRELCHDASARQDMASCGQSLVDGWGALRVAQVLTGNRLSRPKAAVA